MNPVLSPPSFSLSFSLLYFLRSTLEEKRERERESRHVAHFRFRPAVTLVTLLMSRKGSPRADSPHPTRSLLTSFSWPVLPPGVDRPAQRHFSPQPPFLVAEGAATRPTSNELNAMGSREDERGRERRLKVRGEEREFCKGEENGNSRKERDKRALAATFLACTVSRVSPKELHFLTCSPLVSLQSFHSSDLSRRIFPTVHFPMNEIYP